MHMVVLPARLVDTNQKTSLVRNKIGVKSDGLRLSLALTADKWRRGELASIYRPAQPIHISRGSLLGDQLMRMVYVDESGISAGEPYLVVAGAIVHADRQWKALEKHLHAMRDDLLPRDQRRDACFHATELFSGTKKFLRDAWPKERRWKILDELVSIPSKFDLPLVCGFVRKEEFKAGNPTINSATSLAVNAQAVAFNVCVLAADRWMQESAEADEVALVIAENNHEAARGLMRSLVNCNRNPTKMATPDEGCRRFLPLTRIVDTVHFVQKLDSSLLQVADACAFSIMRRLRKAEHSDRFYKPLEPCLVARPDFASLDLLP
jgi:Protein of unknown function (DUF3800)